MGAVAVLGAVSFLPYELMQARQTTKKKSVVERCFGKVVLGTDSFLPCVCAWGARRSD